MPKVPSDADLKLALRIALDMRQQQRAFFKSEWGTKQKTEHLTAARKLERDFDKFTRDWEVQ
jgi:hypothetical protein